MIKSSYCNNSHLKSNKKVTFGNIIEYFYDPKSEDLKYDYVSISLMPTPINCSYIKIDINDPGFLGDDERELRTIFNSWFYSIADDNPL